MPTRMNKVWRYLGPRQHIFEHIPNLRQEAAMRREIVVPRKQGMLDLVLAVKEAETREEAIPVYMHQGQTITK